MTIDCHLLTILIFLDAYASQVTALSVRQTVSISLPYLAQNSNISDFNINQFYVDIVSQISQVSQIFQVYLIFYVYMISDISCIFDILSISYISSISNISSISYISSISDIKFMYILDLKKMYLNTWFKLSLFKCQI